MATFLPNLVADVRRLAAHPENNQALEVSVVFRTLSVFTGLLSVQSAISLFLSFAILSPYGLTARILSCALQVVITHDFAVMGTNSRPATGNGSFHRNTVAAAQNLGRGVWTLGRAEWTACSDGIPLEQAESDTREKDLTKGTWFVNPMISIARSVHAAWRQAQRG